MKCVPTASGRRGQRRCTAAQRHYPQGHGAVKELHVPVGPEDGMTVAAKVTCWPNTDGSSDDVNAVAVA